MLQQYFAIRAENPGVLLAMRVGDFYEFYGDDAVSAAEALEITLTGREDGGNRIPMAGVPFHSVEKYLARLLQKGLKVAICDQLEDPKAAKGLVKRGVTRVMTPGTVVEDSILEAGRNNFLAALARVEGAKGEVKQGLAILDSSTGEFWVTEISGEETQERLLQELSRIRASELLIGPGNEAYAELARSSLGAAITETKPLRLDSATKLLTDRLKVANLDGYGCQDKEAAILAAAAVVQYADQNKLKLDHLQGIITYSVDGFMRLDPATRRSLELTQNLADGSRKYTLLGVLDSTRTPMGARMIRRWIEQPLLDREQIDSRLGAVELFLKDSILRGDFREDLKKVGDIERLVARCSTGLAGPRDLAALRASLQAMPNLLDRIDPIGFGRLRELIADVGNHFELVRALEVALVDEPPHSIREGGIIRPGHDLELDKLRNLSRNGKQFIAELERAEREATGIATLKVGFNSVFGYFLEVTKNQVEKVPSHYIRKQTTANAERYITADLKEHEAQVLGAEEKANVLETDLFQRLRMQVAEHASSLLKSARAIGEMDVLACFAEVATMRRYVRPVITPEGLGEDRLQIRVGRHPVVEANTSMFVPNDLWMEDAEEKPRCMILTGPNMAGKSTYLRQAALIQLMAQIGSFVPAESATLGLCDRIFARIGAKDELALGQSTFMVEMVESANILNHATRRSLVILDEVGRGTSTFDGLAIAWAMVEHLASVGAKTLFATHYHQLNTLSDQLPQVANFRVAVEEFGDDIVWTHKVLPGGTDRSYGIHVARMAGVPPTVLNRATEILSELEQGSGQVAPVPSRTQKLQMTLFDVEASPVQQELERVDVNRLTPLEALRLLDEWKRKFSS